MRRCLLNDDGTVNYYLCASDSTKKEDGITVSVLDGTDGQVMVEILKFAYKYAYNAATNVHSWLHGISLYLTQQILMFHLKLTWVNGNLTEIENGKIF